MIKTQKKGLFVEKGKSLDANSPMKWGAPTMRMDDSEICIYTIYKAISHVATSNHETFVYWTVFPNGKNSNGEIRLLKRGNQQRFKSEEPNRLRCTMFGTS